LRRSDDVEPDLVTADMARIPPAERPDHDLVDSVIRASVLERRSRPVGHHSLLEVLDALDQDLDVVNVGGHTVAVPDQEHLVALAAALPWLLGRPIQDHRPAVESCTTQQVKRVSGWASNSALYKPSKSRAAAGRCDVT
jgi:hypothetical protein